MVTAGEGSTSEGEFWESLNVAAMERLPLLYLIEDNGYAISVPVEVNTAGGSISNLVSSFPDLFVQEVDGFESREVELGEDIGGRQVIKAGLHDGERVVASSSGWNHAAGRRAHP